MTQISFYFKNQNPALLSISPLIWLVLALLYTSPTPFADTTAFTDKSAELKIRLKQLQKTGKTDKAIKTLQKLITLQQQKHGNNHINVGLSLYKLAKLYHQQKRYKQAKSLYNKSIPIISKAIGANNFYMAIIADTLGRFYQDQKRYKPAEQSYQQALKITQIAKGKHHPTTGNILSKLAGMAEFQKHYKRAENYYLQSLAVYKATPTKTTIKNMRNMAATRYNLGRLYFIQKRYNEALPQFQSSAHYYKQANGRDHVSITIPLKKLVRIYGRQKRYSQARISLMRMLQIYQKHFGNTHLKVANTLDTLARLSKVQEQYDEAEQFYHRSLKIKEKAYSKTHKKISSQLITIAEINRLQGAFSKAEPLVERSLAIDEKLFGKRHVRIARSLNMLALIHKVQGHYVQAEPLYKRSIQIYETLPNKERHQLSGALNNLANMYNLQKLYKKAELLYSRSLRIDEKRYGKLHMKVGKTLNNLAINHMFQNQFTKAKPLFLRALDIYEKVLGKNHTMVAITLDNYANLFKRQGRFKQAEALMLRSLSILQKAVGANHKDVGISLGNLGALYNSWKRDDKAINYYKQSLVIAENIFGADHPSIAVRLKDLKNIYKRQKRFQDVARIEQRLKQMPEKGTRHTPLYFVTNRTVQSHNKHPVFNAGRDKTLHLGQAVLQIPNQELKKLAQRQADGIGLSHRNRQGKLTTAHSLKIKRLKLYKSARSFQENAQKTLKRAAHYKKQILVFVHGYNTDFNEAIKRTGQIAFDLNFDGALMPFIWPSQGSLTGYFYDRTSAFDAQKHLVTMLDTLAVTLPDTKIHFISHSMGNLVLLGALEKLALRKKAGDNLLGINHNLGEVILAHPDVDTKIFARYAKAIKPLVSGITLYTNANDLALKVSGWARLNKRAGGKVLIVPQIDTVDTTGMGTGSGLTALWKSVKGGFNHDVFVRNPILFGELTRLLRHSTRPVHKRSPDFVLTKSQSGKYWQFMVRP